MCVCGKKKTCGGSDGCVRDWVFCFPFREKSGSPVAKTGIGWLADCRPRRSNPITAALWEQTQQRTVQACTRTTYTAHTHTKHLKRALLFSSERYREDEGVCVCVFVYTRKSTARFLSKEQFLYSFLPHERVQGRVKVPDETSSRPHRSAAAQQHWVLFHCLVVTEEQQ